MASATMKDSSSHRKELKSEFGNPAEFVHSYVPGAISTLHYDKEQAQALMNTNRLDISSISGFDISYGYSKTFKDISAYLGSIHKDFGKVIDTTLDIKHFRQETYELFVPQNNSRFQLFKPADHGYHFVFMGRSFVNEQVLWHVILSFKTCNLNGVVKARFEDIQNLFRFLAVELISTKYNIPRQYFSNPNACIMTYFASRNVVIQDIHPSSICKDSSDFALLLKHKELFPLPRKITKFSKLALTKLDMFLSKMCIGNGLNADEIMRQVKLDGEGDCIIEVHPHKVSSPNDGYAFIFLRKDNNDAICGRLLILENDMRLYKDLINKHEERNLFRWHAILRLD